MFNLKKSIRNINNYLLSCSRNIVEKMNKLVNYKKKTIFLNSIYPIFNIVYSLIYI